MKLVNNLYYEALYAHFKYVFLTKDDGSLSFDGECFISDNYRFPPNFFDWFDITKAKEEEEAHILQKRNYEEMKARSRKLPKLEGVELPTPIYYELWGIKFALKEMIVPHPDGTASSVKYRYQFYRIWSLLKFILTTNSAKRAILFNSRLKSREVKVVKDLFPSITNVEVLLNLAQKKLEIPNEWLSTTKGCEFTTRMKCITMMQMMTAMGIDFSKVNLTQYAKFLHQFFSKPIPKDEKGRDIIANSPLYKTIKTIYSVSPNRLKGDLIHIKSELVQFDFGVIPTPYKTMLNQLDNMIIETKKK